MSDFEDEQPFKQHTYGHETGSGKTTTKSVRFGFVELAIFMGLWIVMIIGFKLYTRYRRGERNSWFGKHVERDNYENLLTNEPDNEDALKKALMRRAMTDLRRLWRLNEERDSLQSLNKAGAISEDMWLDFKNAEKEMELEVFDLQAEAETFKAGWGADILREAASLVRIEEEVAQARKRQDAESKQKQPEKKPGIKATESSPPKAPILDEKERQRLLEELLADSNDQPRKRGGPLAKK